MTIQSAIPFVLAAVALIGLGFGLVAGQRWLGGRAHEAERLRRFYDAFSCGIIVQDAGGRVLHANQAARDLLGTTDVVMAGSPGADHRVVHEDGSSAEGDAHPLSQARRTGLPVRGVVHGVSTGTPLERWCLVDAVPVFDPATGVLVEAVASLTDITERRRAERALLNTTDTLSALIQASPLAILAFDPAGKVTTWSAAAEQLFGWRASEVVGHLLPAIAPDQQRTFREHHLAVLQGQSFIDLEVHWQRRDGKPVILSLALAPLYGGLSEVRGVMVLAADLTERKKLESQLRQSQKMEAVGQLAGGVAHDFNNLLTAIIGYTSLLLKASPTGQQREDLLEIDRAAARATELTQQLLAFSRRQMLQPTLLDLNAVLSDTMRMMGRLLGEHIELAILPDSGLGMVRADRGQIEQVIINLAVNARDAMEGGGKLILETRNVTLDRDYASHHPGAVEGEFVMLAVTDSGIGMSADIQARIFEPFFTTKERGKGTGLGLSTAYGIIKQSGGTIYVYSEPDRGTTFKIYLPRVMAAQGPTILPAPAKPVSVRGAETVLVVEDEEGVRSLTCRVLRTYGYTVLEAENGGEALLIAEQHPAPIHILLTDVVLPRMSGRKLAERLVRASSKLRVLYMSGYTDGSIVNHGALEPGTSFIQKPFTPEGLTQKLREVLDSPDGSVPPA
ncbi:MAG: PAS domain-containing protein [Gemmatimonadota bacterium]|nr:PAS domain-containing protein [Gemmatimonadota bacterium]